MTATIETMPETYARFDVHVDLEPSAEHVASVINDLNRAYVMLAWIDSPEGRGASASESFVLRFFEVARSYNYWAQSAPQDLIATTRPAPNAEIGTFLSDEGQLRLLDFMPVGSFTLSFDGLFKPLEILWRIFDPEERRHRSTMHKLEEGSARLDNRKKDLEIRAIERQEIIDVIKASIIVNDQIRDSEINLSDSTLRLLAESQEVLINGLYSRGVTAQGLELELEGPPEAALDKKSSLPELGMD